jgi:hypothetical protein
LIARGAALHVILPCDHAEFRTASVSPFGAAWEPRFDALLNAAETVFIIEQTVTLSDAAILLASEVAMGATRYLAARNESVAVSLRVPAKDKPAPTDLWIAAGLPVVLLPLESLHSAESPPLLQAQRLCYLALAGADAADMPLLPGCLHSWQEQDVMIQSFADIDAGLSALSLTGEDRASDISCALDLRITEVGMDDRSQRNGIARMAKAADAGSVIIGKSAAMLAGFDSGTEHIEPLGEMAGSDGAFEIYAFHRFLPL